MYFIGTVKNVKGESLKGAIVDVVSIAPLGIIIMVLTVQL